MKSVNILIQARMNSTRLPGKVMADVNGRPLISLLIERLRESRKVDEIIVATTVSGDDDRLVEHLDSLGVKSFRGNELDVLDRFYHASLEYPAHNFVRITADCPLLDPTMLDEVIELHFATGAQYTSNTLPPTYPDGLDIEVMTAEALALAYSHATAPFDREHVTPFLRNSEDVKKANYAGKVNLSHHRWTVDEEEDLALIRAIIDSAGLGVTTSWIKILEFLNSNPELIELNSMITRNEGATMSNGQKLWKRAKKVIPGGTMLFSKRPELFAPEIWPAYFSKAKGCSVWDLDGAEYLDLSFMGVGTNILGYSNDEVDSAVVSAARSGNMSTLNNPYEVYLAEKLVEMHNWADMVKFARSGGEANAIAIRIGRAASGKDNVAVCGYHGWHDWYLSANHSVDDQLGEMLLPGLSPAGVPRALAGTVLPFRYNDIAALEHLLQKYDVGVVKMEVMRDIEPENHFLSKVRQLTQKFGAVLIFDECTSGFRETFGGLHKKYEVTPDIAMFGKALGNGYAVTSVIGSKEVMEHAQSSFISSTFWTEKIGSVAALKTLEVMEETRSWEYITREGKFLREGITKLAANQQISIRHIGIDALVGYVFESPHAAIYKTFITQEMLKRGYLAGTSTYISLAHTREMLEKYLDHLEDIFELIKMCETGERDPKDILDGPVCHSTFARLN